MELDIYNLGFLITNCDNIIPMITDADIKKMKSAFVTRDEFKKGLKTLDSRMENGFIKIIDFIGETRVEIITAMTKQLEELKDITRRHQITLENHDSRITHLEYVTK